MKRIESFRSLADVKAEFVTVVFFVAMSMGMVVTIGLITYSIHDNNTRRDAAIVNAKAERERHTEEIMSRINGVNTRIDDMKIERQRNTAEILRRIEVVDERVTGIKKD